MKANAGQIERALDAPDGAVRLFLLYGADDSTSQAQAARLVRAMGAGAERVDLDGAKLKDDPGLLAGEAAAISMFGDKRYIRLTSFGEESLPAIERLLDAPQSGNPVVAIAGALKGTSALVKRAVAHPAAMVCVNYPLDDDKAEGLALAMARAEGVRLQPEAARALAAAAANDRAVMAREVEKLALYLDAAPDRPCEAGMLALEAIGAGEGEGELGRLVDAVLDGKPGALAGELAMLAEGGSAGIPVLRAVARRVTLLGGIVSKIEDGAPPGPTLEAGLKPVFWKDENAVKRQVRRWSADRLATAAGRLLAAERAIKSAASAGDILGDAELHTIARAGQRRS